MKIQWQWTYGQWSWNKGKLRSCNALPAFTGSLNLMSIYINLFTLKIEVERRVKPGVQSIQETLIHTTLKHLDFTVHEKLLCERCPAAEISINNCWFARNLNVLDIYHRQLETFHLTEVSNGCLDSWSSRRRRKQTSCVQPCAATPGSPEGGGGGGGGGGGLLQLLVELLTAALLMMWEAH